MSTNSERFARLQASRNRLLETVACQAAETVFVPQYQRPDNLDERKIEGLGVAISQWAQWDINTILLVSAAALEDANCPGDLVAILREMPASLDRDKQAFWAKLADDIEGHHNGSGPKPRFREPWPWG